MVLQAEVNRIQGKIVEIAGQSFVQEWVPSSNRKLFLEMCHRCREYAPEVVERILKETLEDYLAVKKYMGSHHSFSKVSEEIARACVKFLAIFMEHLGIFMKDALKSLEQKLEATLKIIKAKRAFKSLIEYRMQEATKAQYVALQEQLGALEIGLIKKSGSNGVIFNY